MGERVWSVEGLKDGNENNSSDKFVGMIEDVSWNTDDYGRERLELQISASNRDSGHIRWYYRYSEHRNSIWGKFVEALDKCGVALSDENNLVGLTFEWEFVEVEFGTDYKTGNVIKTKMLVPIAFFADGDSTWSDAEIKEAVMKISGEQSVTDFMKQMDIPAKLKKKVLMSAMNLDEEGVISYNLQTGTIKPTNQ